MNRDAQLKFCSVCKNKTFNPKHGIICGLTNELPTFSGICKDYLEDERQVRLESLAQDKEVAETTKTLNKGRYSLLLIGGLYVLIGFLEAFVLDGHQLLFGIIDWIIASVFIGFGIWSFYKPFVALLSGLALYVLLILVFSFFDPTTLFKGIIWKVLIITYLVYSIKVAKNEQSKNKNKKEELLDQI